MLSRREVHEAEDKAADLLLDLKQMVKTFGALNNVPVDGALKGLSSITEAVHDLAFQARQACPVDYRKLANGSIKDACVEIHDAFSESRSAVAREVDR